MAIPNEKVRQAKKFLENHKISIKYVNQNYLQLLQMDLKKTLKKL